MKYIEDYFKKLKQGLDNIDKQKIIDVAHILLNARENNKQIFILGNGGSASTASHFACDLGKGTLQNVYNNVEERFRVISLTDNVSTISAYSNDLSYDDVFVQQLRNLITPGDVVIAITGSGNSANVVNAMKYAAENNAITIGLLGFEGGKVGKMVDHPIVFRENNYARVEDAHLILAHLISSYIYGKNNK